MQQIVVSSKSAGWEWLDIENPTPEELQTVAQQYQLHPSSMIDTLQPEHLPKYEFIDQVLFIITRLHDPKAHQEADTIQEITNKLAVFYTSKFLITIHKHPVKVLSEVKAKFIDTGKINTASQVLIKILKGSIKTFEAPAIKLAEELDYYESKIFLTKKIPPLNKGLYHLKRKAAVSKRVIQLASINLESLTLPEFSQPEVQDLKDAFLLLENQYEEISDSANHLVNTYISLASQKTNDVVRVLTIFSVFFMPLTFIAGIYGMNFSYMPDLDLKWGYPAVLVLMAGVTISIYWWFKRKGWL